MEMFTAFLERVKPDSTKVNPACMKNTKIPDKRIQSMVKSSLTSTAVVELISERFNIVNDYNFNQKYRFRILTIKNKGVKNLFLLF
jgi:rRNA maturation protein Rpf1